MRKRLEEEVIPEWQPELKVVKKAAEQSFYRRIFNVNLLIPNITLQYYGPLGALLAVRIRELNIMESLVSTQDSVAFMKNMFYYFYFNLVMCQQRNVD